MKNYTIVWTNGYKFRVHLSNDDAVKELEADGFCFDDFCDDGTGEEIWVQEG